MVDLALLSPWDAMPYFETPRETFTSLGVTYSQLLVANPRRVAIIFAPTPATYPIFLSTLAGAQGQEGLVIGANNPTLILRQADVGPLVAMDWFGAATASGMITIVEIILSRWPGE